jgi:protein subunit release factor A
MSVFIEIRSGEGGDDAKLLVQDQFAIYVKMGSRRSL